MKRLFSLASIPIASLVLGALILPTAIADDADTSTPGIVQACGTATVPREIEAGWFVVDGPYPTQQAALNAATNAKCSQMNRQLSESAFLFDTCATCQVPGACVGMYYMFDSTNAGYVMSVEQNPNGTWNLVCTVVSSWWVSKSCSPCAQAQGL